MKAWMEPEGTLVIEASDGVEYYALRKWQEDFNVGKTILSIPPFDPSGENMSVKMKKAKNDPH